MCNENEERKQFNGDTVEDGKEIHLLNSAPWSYSCIGPLITTDQTEYLCQFLKIICIQIVSKNQYIAKRAILGRVFMLLNLTGGKQTITCWISAYHSYLRHGNHGRNLILRLPVSLTETWRDIEVDGFCYTASLCMVPFFVKKMCYINRLTFPSVTCTIILSWCFDFSKCMVVKAISIFLSRPVKHIRCHLSVMFCHNLPS